MLYQIEGMEKKFKQNLVRIMDQEQSTQALQTDVNQIKQKLKYSMGNIPQRPKSTKKSNKKYETSEKERQVDDMET